MGLLGSAKKLTDTQKYYIDNFGKALLTKGVTFDVAESACKDVGHFLITQKDFAFNIASFDKFLEELIKKGYPIAYIKKVSESVKLFYGFLNKEIPNDTEVMRKVVKSASKEATVGTVVESAVEGSTIMETGLLIYILSFLRWVKLLAGLKMLYFLLFGVMGLAGTAYVAKNPEVIKEATNIAKQAGQSLSNVVRIIEVRKEVVTQGPTQVGTSVIEVGTTYNDSYIKDFNDMLSELKDRLTKVEAEESPTNTTTDLTNLITQLETLRTELTSNLHYSPFEIRNTNGDLLSSYTSSGFDLRTNLLVNGNTTVTGDTILNTLTAASAEVTGDLVVDGNAEIKKNLTVDENIEVKGDLTVGGVLKMDTKDSEPSDGEEGDVYYNESDNAMYVYDGGNWRVVGPYEVGPVGGLEITGKRVSLLSTCTNGQILKFNSGSGIWECGVDTGGSGSTTFIGLTDTPSSYTANNLVKVNALGTALEFLDYSGWDTNASNDITTTGVLGDILYNNGTSWVTLTAGTSGQYLRTNGAASPTWNTITGLPTGLTGQTLRNNGTSWIANDNLYNNGTSIGIGTTSPQFRLDVSGDGSVIARGSYGSGMVQPLTGSFTAMMWYPRKAAFRAGYSGIANQWNDANIGNYSVALGQGQQASGQASVALGWNNTASNLASVAIGQSLTSSGSSSVALGYGGVASGDQSTAINYYTTATGQNALAANEYTTAQSRASTVLGRYNVISGDAGNWVSTDPLFVVGNGSGAGTRNNALTLLKDGSFGIGASVPNARLTVGNNNQFAVNTTGNITRINDIPYSFPSSQGAASTILQNNGSGTLTWGTAPSGLPGGVQGNVLYHNGTSWVTLAAGTAGQVLRTNGASANPAWNTVVGLPTGTSGQTLRNNGTTWVADSFLYNNGTRIGIGTTSPSTSLDIATAGNGITFSGSGTHTIQATGGTLELNLFSTYANSNYYGLTASAGNPLRSSAYPALVGRYWNGSTSTDYTAYVRHIISSTAPESRLGFFINSSERMSVKNNGNVGIGTTYPIGRLDVAYGGTGLVIGADNNAATRTDAVAKVARIVIPHTTNAEEPSLMLYSTSSNLYLGGGTGTANAMTGIRFYTATDSITTTGTERMRLDFNGNLGIGTTNPNSRLTIGNNNQFRIDSTGNITRINDVAYSWPVSQGGANTLLTNNGSGTLTWGTAPSGLPSGVTGQTLRHNGTTWVANSTLYNNGTSVGVGTTAPLSALKLDVNGMGRFSDQLIADNKLTVSNSTNMSAKGTVLTVNKQLGSDDTGSWSVGTTGGLARSAHTSVVYNHKIYVWGGSNGSRLNTMNVYDLATHTWTLGTTGGSARNYHTAVVYNGKMYIWGGFSTIAGFWTNAMDIYDFTTNTWSAGVSGGTARGEHTAAVYNNKMYIWGGTNGGILNTVDIYDFSTSIWSTGTAGGGLGRYAHSAVVYNGKMYIWGGIYGGVLNTMYVYDLVTNTWNTGVSGGTAREGHTAITYNGKMYIWGGSNTGYLNTIDMYDFSTSTWTTGVSGGTARAYHTAVIYDGQMYVWGGYASSYLNTMDIYTLGNNQNILALQDNNQDTLTFKTGNTLETQGNALSIQRNSNDSYSTAGWSTGTAGGTSRWSHSAVIYNGQMYVWGGVVSGIVNTMDIYNFGEKSWSVGTAGGTGRWYHSAVVYNGKMYIWGGGTPGATNTMDIYDFAAGTWSTGTTGGTARYGHIAVVYNGKMYTWGGLNGGTYLNTMDIYDFASNTWTTGTTGGTARSAQSAVVYNGRIYIWGGADSGGSLNTMDIYDFAAGTWSTGTTGGTARNAHTAVLYNSKMYAWAGSPLTNTMDIYDFATSTWSTGTAGGTTRYSHTSVVYDGAAYNWGGTDGGTNYNTVDVYNFGDSSNDDILVLRGNQNSGVLENETKDGQNNLFRFTTSGRAYSGNQGGWYSGGADLAEYYSSNEELQAGDVVSIDETETKDSTYVKKTNETNRKNVMGVVSTNPGFVAGAYTEGGYPIGLAGRVPVKVTTENGAIQKGDRLVAASKAGYAKKACGIKTCESDISIGIALESFSSNESGDSESVVEKIVEDKAMMEVKIEEAEKTLTTFEEIDKVEETKEKVESLTEVGVTEKQGEGRVMMFVNLGYFIGKLDNSGILKTTPIIDTNIVGDTAIENVEVSTTQNQVDLVDTSIADSKAILSALNINTETSILEIIKETTFKELVTFIKEVRFLAEVTFEKTVTYLGEVIFKNKVEFAGDININNKNVDIKTESLTINGRLISKDKDMGGFVKIEKGQKEVTIKFDKSYSSKPVVTVTADSASLKYGIKDIDQKEFTIYITGESDKDENFSWIAILVDESINNNNPID